MKYILTILITIFALYVNATDYTTTADGSWTNGGTWSGGGYPDDSDDNATLDNNHDVTTPNTGIKITISQLHFNNNSSLTVNENDTLICDSMVIWNNADLIIDGVLIIQGGVHMNNNSFMNVLLDGEIDIQGDLYGGNNADLNVDGTMTVDGEVDWNGDTPTGSGTINGEPVGTLPIELLEFIANNIEGRTIINWTTASELNNNYFILEKSIDGYNYEEIARINGSGTTSMINEYSYTDYSVNDELTYYRLKQTDFDGQSETFDPIAVESNISKSIKNIFVTEGTIQTSIESYNEGTANISIINICGQIVHQEEQIINRGMNSININTINAEKGIYLMRIDMGNSATTQKFVF